MQKAICDLAPEEEIEGFYVLKSAASRTSNTGSPYLSAVVADRTGSIQAMVWDYSGPIGAADEGKIVKLRARVRDYRGAPQLTVGRIRTATEQDPVDRSLLVPVAPIDPDAAMSEVEAILASMGDADYRRICEAMLERHRSSFTEIPAAKSVHHSFLNGLLMHTLSMLRAADFLAGLYGDIVDRSLLLAGTLLHDFGKEKEFNFSELGLVTDYSPAGHLLGHLSICAAEIAELARELNVPDEKSMLLQHMILSHHGEPEFGAAVRPATAESELLSHLDLLDSRMEIYRETLDELEPGEFSPRIFALERRIYRHN